MNRALTLLCFLCTVLGARGQSAYNWVYWFDTDSVPKYSGTAGNNSFTIDAMTNELSEGFHTFHVQVADTAGCFSSPQTRLFYRTKDQSAAVLRYWFDSDQAKIHEANFDGGNFTINVNGIEAGLHIINCQVVDASGKMSDVVSRFFIRQIETRDMSWSYWFDDDKDNVQTVQHVDGAVMVDVTELAEGFHTIHQQVHGLASSDIISKWFLKIPQTNQVGDMTVICTVDNKIVAQQNTSPQGGIISMQMDVDSLDFGLHRAAFQVITPTGTASTVAERYFLRVVSDRELNRMHCVYSIDGHQSNSLAGSMGDGIFHFDLDVAGLEDGLHRLSYMMVSEEGVTTSQKTAFFWKTPLGGPGIVQYDYWLNDDEEHLHKVKLDKREDPFKLITLLPVETQPIRSSCFHFEVKDAKPMIYAKNDFHIRFFDTSAKVLNETKQFVDYHVGQEVTNITDLFPTQTFTLPDSNSVKWFSFEAMRGDSIALKSSQATGINIYSAEGTCLYDVNGSKSVALGGIHVPKDGIYYVAIHDVTGTKSNNLTLQSFFMGKFDLQSTSKPEFGVLPCVQILELDGNGFDNLKSALFRMGEKEIVADSIACIDKSKAKLYFLFNGDESYGNYDLVLNFDDGDDRITITREGLVALIEPSFDDIEIVISDPRSVADPYPVHITVTNKSNICYQAIPFYFAIDHIDQIESVKYMNFGVSCSRELYENGLELSFEYDSFEGNNSKTRVVPTVIPELMPGESRTYTLGVKTGNHSLFNVYAWNGRPWNLLAPETSDFIARNYSDIVSASSRRRAPGIAGVFDGCEDDPCDLAGPLSAPAECACGTALALGGTLGGIQNALQNQHNRAMRDQLAQSGLFDNPEEYFPDQHLPSPEDLMWYWLQHCLPGKAGQATSAYNTGRQMLGDDPCQDPPPHSTNPYNPGDPNEIFGYMAESGSKYIRQDLMDVSYSIEFENDPQLANASAHRIEVRDTLNTSLFDISTFKPTSIKIGEKSIELDGEQNFVKTIDMRSEINAIAQVQLEFNQQIGVAVWTITSLDPMTMEETFDIMQGVLPVNNNGNGIGYINFDISLKQPLDDGENFSNRASIVFDYEDPIMTPTWTNTVDATAPVGRVTDVTMVTDSTLSVKVEATDNLSMPWQYDLYRQVGADGEWERVAMSVPVDSLVELPAQADINYGFYAVVTDSAGNVEQKEAEREFSLTFYTDLRGDVNSDGDVDIADAVCIVNHVVGKATPAFNEQAADVNADGDIDIADAVRIVNLVVGKIDALSRRLHEQNDMREPE